MTRFHPSYTVNPKYQRIKYVELTYKGLHKLPQDLKAQTALVGLNEYYELYGKKQIPIDEAFYFIEINLRRVKDISLLLPLTHTISIVRCGKTVVKPIYEVIYGVAGQYYWTMRLLNNLEVNGFIKRLDKYKCQVPFKAITSKTSMVNGLKQYLGADLS